MTHLDANLERARMHTKHHTGIAERVRAELDKGPATVEQIAERTGIARHRVKASISHMVGSSGGVMAIGKIGNLPIYARTQSIERPQRDPADFSFAAPISIGRGYANWPGQRRGG